MTPWLRSLVLSLCSLFMFAATSLAADSPEQLAAEQKFREELPLGGNFQPRQEEGIFVATGHGLSVMVSRDDGKTWEETFYAGPGHDHSHWATWNNVAYTNGVFAIAAGWGKPGTIIASDDGKNWRHLTAGTGKPLKKDGHPFDMTTTMQFLGVNGAFVMPFQATPDFGKTWYTSNQYQFPAEEKAFGKEIGFDNAHPALGYGNGRFISVGDKGPMLYSDDMGKSWHPMKPELEKWEGNGAKSIVYFKDAWLLLKGDGSDILRSTDNGKTWKAHDLGITRPASRTYALSVLGDEVWATGQTSKASKDGMTWYDLSKEVPASQLTISDRGTIIGTTARPATILRSTDHGKTWEKVYTSPRQDVKWYSDVQWGKVNKAK